MGTGEETEGWREEGQGRPYPFPPPLPPPLPLTARWTTEIHGPSCSTSPVPQSGWLIRQLSKITTHRTSLEDQWLRLCASNARGAGLIPRRGTKIPHAAQCSQKNKKKRSPLINFQVNYIAFKK